MGADASDDSAGVPWAAGWARTDPLDLALPDDAPMPATPEDCPGVEHCAPGASLHERITRVERSVQVMAASNVQLGDAVAGLTVAVQAQDRRIDEHAARLAGIEATGQRVETLVQGVADVLAAGRVVSKGAGVIGGLAKPAAVLVLAAAALSAAASDWAVGVWQGLARAARIVTGGHG